jgi:alkylation response protein AidB-like acyl-CoA dehydrogenase
MASFLKDNDDLLYYFEKGLDWDALVEATERGGLAASGYGSTAEAVAFFREIAETVGEFVATEIAPYTAEIDRGGVIFENGEARFPARAQGIFDSIKQLELHGLCVPRELGGLNAPMALYYLVSEMFGRADVSIMAHHGFHGGMAAAALMFSVREGTTKFDPKTGALLETRFRTMIEEIVKGQSWGCMYITEPDAGSDMARLRAVGEQDAQGNWFVTGQKIFNTSGHGKWHFVIARTEKIGSASPSTPVVETPGSEEDPMAGLKGLSMFLVPTYEDLPSGERKRVVTLERVEEKLGHHASVTAALSFDRAPAQLVGQRGEGFEYMLLLMNGARVGVGFECLGLCEAAIRIATDYAAQRRSMGKTIDKHEMIADYLDEMRTDAQALRALCVHGTYHEELAQKLAMKLRLGEADLGEGEKKALAKRIAKHKRSARRVTPLLKYFGAEKAVEMARRAIQIHGGVGYTKEYGAEKLLRDAMVMPIYEGTSQIQALMAMKDTLGAIMKRPQAFLRHGAQARWRAMSARDPLERRLAKLQATSHAAQQHLVLRTAGDKFKSVQDHPLTEWPERFSKNWNPKRDFAFAMLHAERLIKILIDEAVAEILWGQAQEHPERRAVLERWLERAEPRARFLLDEITTTGDRLLSVLHPGEHAPAGEARAQAAE